MNLDRCHSERSEESGRFFTTRPFAPLRVTAFLMVVIFGLSACGPTYRADKITQEVRKLSKTEYGLDVETKLVDHTLSVRVPVDNLMGVLLSSESADGKKAWDLMTVMSRVCLSTDAPIQFFVVVAADRQDPRNRFLFIRYVEDIKRVMLDDISRGEFFDRTLIELKLRGKTYFIDPSELDFLKVLMLTLGTERETGPLEPQTDESWIEDISLPDFLARAAAQGLKRALKENSQASQDFVIREVQGEYQPGPALSERAASFDKLRTSGPRVEGRFLFRLDVIKKPFLGRESGSSSSNPGVSSGAIGSMLKATQQSMKNILKTPKMSLEQDLLPLSAGEISKFLKHYHFRNFSSIEVVEINSGRSLAMPYH